MFPKGSFEGNSLILEGFTGETPAWEKAKVRGHIEELKGFDMCWILAKDTPIRAL